MDSFKKLLIFSALLATAALLPVTSATAATPSNSMAAQTRVIITLAVPADADRAAISQATDALLAALPGGDYKVTNRYEVVPYVAITAGAVSLTVLSALEQSGLVVAIERDGTVNAASSAKKCKTVKSSKRQKLKSAKKCASLQAVH